MTMYRFTLGFLEVLNHGQLKRLGTNMGAFDAAYADINPLQELLLSIFEHPKGTLNVEQIGIAFQATYKDNTGSGSTPDLAIFEAINNC